jgi:hypothetical protein
VQDDNAAIRSQMRLVQVLYLQGIIDEAEELYIQLSTSYFNQLTSETNYELYQELKTLLKIR